jgi:hypothetical protein
VLQPPVQVAVDSDKNFYSFMDKDGQGMGSAAVSGEIFQSEVSETFLDGTSAPFPEFTASLQQRSRRQRGDGASAGAGVQRRRENDGGRRAHHSGESDVLDHRLRGDARPETSNIESASALKGSGAALGEDCQTNEVSETLVDRASAPLPGFDALQQRGSRRQRGAGQRGAGQHGASAVAGGSRRRENDGGRRAQYAGESDTLDHRQHDDTRPSTSGVELAYVASESAESHISEGMAKIKIRPDRRGAGPDGRR